MKKILLILLCLGLAGCVSALRARKSENQIIELQESIRQKDAEINRLQQLSDEKEGLIARKDLKIQQLRKRLEGFGVFE